MANHKLKIAPGDRFGLLSVVSEVGRDASGKCLFKCQCDCGNEKVVSSSDLKAGRIVSCGCRKSKAARDCRGYHGHTKEPIYAMWSGMIQRCTNAKQPGFSEYGGRGIKVCEEWRDFRSFYDWAMSSGYEDGLSIERKDVNGDYCPENCTFIPWARQCMNKQNTILYKGEVLKHACNRLGLCYSSVYSRIKKLGWSVEDAVEKPFK